MKKLLLSLAAVCAAASVQATTYTIYDNSTLKGEWTENAATEGFVNNVIVNGKAFTITTIKNTSSTKLVEPASEIRVYKNSQLQVESADLSMKGIRITYTNSNYAGDQTLSSGWTGSCTNLTFVGESAGLNTFVLTATNNQVRVAKIEVSDTAGELGQAPEPEYVTVNSVKETIAQPAKTLIRVNYDLTVGFVNNSNIFCVDNAGDFIQIFNSNSYEIGDRIVGGWTATYDLYYSTPEIINCNDLPTAQQGFFTPEVVDPFAITAADVNRVVMVKDVVFSEATPSTKDNFTCTVNGKELEVRNNYQLASVEAGTYNVTFVITVYNDTPQFYIASYNNGGGGELPEGVIYANTFEESISDWTKQNDASLSDFSGWKVNSNSPACAICNSYYGGSNHAADAWIIKAFDLTNYTDVLMTVEQAFGYDFPSKQVDNYTVNVRLYGSSEWDQLYFSAFPEAPASGNWTKTFAENVFDLSEFDGEKIEIGFRYLNEGGSQSRAWELRNFVLSGTAGEGGVEGVIADEDAAPVYYNLQGVRVANPDNGIYIVVKGNKSYKVAF